MRLGIIGSRNINDIEQVTSNLESTLGALDSDNVHITALGGDSKGSERICRDYFAATPFDFVLFKPYSFVDRSVEHDPKYFFYRNKQIIDNSDYVIVFLDHEEGGVSKSFVYLKYNTDTPYTVYGTTGAVIENRG